MNSASSLSTTDTAGARTAAAKANTERAESVLRHLVAASFRCEYRFVPGNGLPPPEDRLELMLTSDDGENMLRVKHHGTGQVFTGADALSVRVPARPRVTGRPRLNGG